MSSSEPDASKSFAPSISKVKVSVTADPATETFIIDHSFRMVARGAGTFSCDLPPGLYKFKYRNGLSFQEEHREIDPNSPEVAVTAPVLELNSPVPLHRTRRVSSDQFGEAERISSGPAIAIGNGSFLFLFVRWESTTPFPPNAAEGLTLRRLDGTKIADAAQAQVSSSGGCAGILLQLDPGAYRLRLAGEDINVEQIVVTSMGWQTQVFMLRQTSDPDPGITLGSMSVLMSRGPFQAGDDMLRYADSARIALSGSRLTMSRQLLQNLLDDKFQSPMLGIYAGHALHAAEDMTLLDRLVNVLQGLVPDHPDVLALSLHRETSALITVPPMLRRSWSEIVDATVQGRAQFAPGSFAARIPSELVGGIPWLVWPEASLLQQVEPEQATASLHQLQQFISNSDSSDELLESLNLSQSEDALFSFLNRRASVQKRVKSTTSGPTILDERGLAKALSTTLPDVQSTVTNLASKLLK